MSHLMSKLRTDKTNGSGLQSAKKDTDRGSAMSLRIYGTGDQNPQASPNPNKSRFSALFSNDLSDRKISTAALAEDHGKVSSASSSTCGDPTNSYGMQGARRLVQVPELGCMREPMPPASRPKAPPHVLSQQHRRTASTASMASTASTASTITTPRLWNVGPRRQL